MKSKKSETQHKKAEEALLKAKEQSELDGKRLEAILETIPSAIVLVDASDGKFSYVNRHAIQLYGFNYVGFDLEAHVAKVKAMKLDGTPYPLENMPVSRSLKFGLEVRNEEMTIERSDGTHLPVLVSSAPLYDTKCKITAAIVIFEDITELKQAEEALLKSEERYRALFEKMDEGFALDEIICDEKGKPYDMRCLAVNPAFEHQTGLKAADIIGKTTLELFPDSEPVLFERYGKVALTGEPARFEEYFGPLSRWFEVYAFQTEPGKFAVIFTDITKRKRDEETLRESEGKYRTIIETASEGIWISDTEGRTTFVNKRMAEMLGYSPEEMIGKLAYDFMDEEAKALGRLNLERRRRGLRESFEQKYIHKDGLTIWALVSATPLGDKDGKIIAYMGMLTDITERKRAEASLTADLAALTRMHALSERVLEPGGLQPLLQGIMDAAVAIMGAERGTLQLLEGDSLRIVAHYGHQQPFLEFFAYAENQVSACGDAMKTRERVVVPDVEKSSLFVGTPSLAMLRKAGVRAIQSTPLISRMGVLLGILTTQWGIPYSPDERDLWRIDLLARQAADLIEHSQAKKALRKAHDELELRVQERTAELEEANQALQAEIKERKRTEATLAESEERLKLAQKAANAGTWDWNMLTGELKWSEEYYSIYGLSTDYEPSYENWLKTIHPDDRDMTNKAVAQAVEQKVDIDIEFRLIRPDGNLCWLNAKGKTFYDEANRPVRMIGITIDITRRKQAEEKIHEQSALLDKANDAILVFDLENHIICWNKGAQRLYGYTKEEAIGKNVNELLYKEKPTQLIETKKSVIEKREWMGELRQVTKDGKGIIVDSRWTLVNDSEGKPKSILVINTGITEKKMFEAHLLRAQRMESIGVLAGGIAHNLNNMLTPMMMSLQTLKEKFKDEQSQKLLTILEKNSQRSAELIKQVLSFSRGVEGERNPLHVANIVYEIGKIAKETFPRNIEIRTDMPIDTLTISGDETQLNQVIMNLCVNARDAMPDGGVLSILAESHFIDENYARMHTEAKVGSYVAIAVSDTGTGISPKILDRIFEPFFTTKEFGKGTGLGLSTSLAIVKSHGGFIDVHSEVGKGAIFRVYLPAIKIEMQTGEEEQLELPAGHGELVLIAEDEESVREVTVSTLKEYGYNVLAASDGADAATLYIQNKDKINIILMDLMMPVMDGHASIRAIRKINPEVKVIVVSGLAEKDKLAKIESTRAQAILLKPYTAERLLKTVHEILSA